MDDCVRLFSRPTRSMFLFEAMCDTVYCMSLVFVTPKNSLEWRKRVIDPQNERTD